MASTNTIRESLANNPFLIGKARAAFVATATAVKAEDPEWAATTAFAVNSRIVAGNVIFEATAIAGTGTSGSTIPDFGLVPSGGTVIDNPGANQITWTHKGERTSPRQVFADRILKGQVNYTIIMVAMLDQLGASASNDYGFDESSLGDGSWETAASNLFDEFSTKQVT